MFGPPEKAAGVDPEQRLLQCQAAREKLASRGLARGHGQRERRDLVDDTRRAERGEQRRVVFELMLERSLSRHAMREQQAAHVGGVAPSFSNARANGDHRRTERVREDDGAAEGTGMERFDPSRGRPVPADDVAEQTGGGEKFGHVPRGGNCDSTFVSKAVVQGAVGGESEDVVADPIEADDNGLCISTTHSLVRFLPFPSTGRASTARARAGRRCAARSHH